MKKLSFSPNSLALSTPAWAYWDNYFTEEELDKIVKDCSALELKEAAIELPDRSFGVDLAKRRSGIAFMRYGEDTAYLFMKLADVVEKVNAGWYGYDLTGFEYLQYTEYDAQGSHYSWHVDMMMGGWGCGSGESQPRKLSFGLALSDPRDYVGGEFSVNYKGEAEAEVIPMPRGRVVLFPSFVLHRVAPVTSGIRRTIIGWVGGPKFR